MSRPRAIICDVDGTVALRGNRNPYDMVTVGADEPNWPVIVVVKATMYTVNCDLIFVSGRHGCYETTDKWLGRYFNFYRLYMRKDKDGRKDATVKKEFLEEIQKEYDIFCVFDDRTSVVEMWREQGLTCFDVAGNNV